MMSRAHRDPVAIQSRSDIFRSLAGECKGEHSDFIRRPADQSQSRYFLEQTSRVENLLMLIFSDPVQPNPIHVIDRRAESNGIRDVPSASFKSPRRWLIKCPLEGDIADHVAATLPRLRFVEERFLPVQHADSGGSEHFVARKYIPVRVQILTIHWQ